jgi:hypothetical protein
VTLGDDRRSIRVSKPLASAANLELYASDSLVPKVNYSIIFDPTTLTINQPRMILFENKWKSVEDYFNITYVTLSGFCPKCVGLNMLDDISYDVRGQLSTSTNERLLIQNLEKFTVTELGSNPFHLFIGTGLINLLGQRISDFDFLSTKIVQEIQSTFAKLKEMQQKYVQTGRPMTTGEQLDQVQDINITRDTTDPTIVRVAITVTALSGQALNYVQFLRTIQTTSIS